MKYSRSNGDCFVLAFEVEFGSKWSLKGKFFKGKEKLQFQRVFLEISGLVKPEIVWKMWIFLCSYWTNKYKMYFYKYSKLWRTTCNFTELFNLSEWRPGGFLVKLKTIVPFVTAHLEIFHCTHLPVIPKSDLYFTFCSTLNALSKRTSK